MPLIIRNHINYALAAPKPAPRPKLRVVENVKRPAKMPKWTPEHDEIVKARYLEDGPSVLAEKLGRSRHSIQNRAYALGVTGQWNGRRYV